MLDSFRRWRRNRILRRYPIPDAAWESALLQSPLSRARDAEQLAHIRKLATLFLHDKDVYGAGGFTVGDEHLALIGFHAGLMVRHLGIDWLRGWHSIYIFPGQFRTRRRIRDSHGLEGTDDRVLAGEASHEGGLVFSWADIIDDVQAGNDGKNVIIHELAHKIDMRNGPADGYPPLHRGMSTRQWAKHMQSAFDDLVSRAQRGHPPIDPYGATNPAEFFAVISEYYFECPEALEESYPEVLGLLASFYGDN